MASLFRRRTVAGSEQSAELTGKDVVASTDKQAGAHDSLDHDRHGDKDALDKNGNDDDDDLNDTGKPVKHIHIHPAHLKTRKRRNWSIFLLGSLCGIVMAGVFAGRNDLIDFPEFGDLSMDSIFDVLPAGLIKDVRDFTVGDYPKSNLSTRASQLARACTSSSQKITDGWSVREESETNSTLSNPFQSAYEPKLVGSAPITQWS